MHEIQKKLFKLAQEKNLGQSTLREIAEMVGETSPQKIKHHMQQLEKRGLIQIDKIKGIVQKTKTSWIGNSHAKTRLVAIPILGTTNAGPAAAIAEQNIEGFLRISDSLLNHRGSRHLFALKVDGPSMNRVNIDGKRIEDGDYAIIDYEYKTPRNGDIVLSIIDGASNIKKFYRDEDGNIVLASDSTQNFPPIYIHKDDNYMINGKVVQIIKRPKLQSE
ncbi:MAG TPA: S24 family peptidase [Bacteroidota bacterium]|nr:S24 family peptidase [Bacteroidota bacterium]